MHSKICCNCTHYNQHYAINSRQIFRIHCGHCTFEKPRHKKPFTKACENYAEGQPDEAAFATKEYLSKELLQYLLNLELLPEIKDAAQPRKSVKPD